MLFQLVKKGTFLIVKKLCTAYGCGMHPVSNIFNVTFNRICRYIRLCFSNGCFNLHAAAVCLYKRNTISESVNIAVCAAIFKKECCVIQIYLLHRDICWL